MAEVWEPSTSRHPGILFIESDGASEHLAVDVRVASPPVMAVNNTSSDWKDAIEQAPSLGDFRRRVEDGSFVFKL